MHCVCPCVAWALFLYMLGLSLRLCPSPAMPQKAPAPPPINVHASAAVRAARRLMAQATDAETYQADLDADMETAENISAIINAHVLRRIKGTLALWATFVPEQIPDIPEDRLWHEATILKCATFYLLRRVRAPPVSAIQLSHSPSAPVHTRPDRHLRQGHHLRKLGQHTNTRHFTVRLRQ